jgi:hypothetical protein
MNAVAMSNDSVAFAVGDSGLIMSNRNKLLSVTNPFIYEPPALVYPNPSTGSFTTKMHLPHTVKVYDLTGGIVYLSATPAYEHNISLRGKSTGVYTISLALEDGSKLTKKVLIQ